MGNYNRLLSSELRPVSDAERQMKDELARILLRDELVDDQNADDSVVEGRAEE